MSWMSPAIALLAACVLAEPAAAQTGMVPIRITDAQVFWFLQNLPPESARPLGGLVNALLADTAGHMKMADRREATSTDSMRAAGIVRTMRTSRTRLRAESLSRRFDHG